MTCYNIYHPEDRQLPYAKVIVNPAAGAGKTARKWPEIKSLLKDLGLSFEDDLTEARGHAIELAK
jgi:diacylglycerol kinase family enzyme